MKILFVGPKLSIDSEYKKICSEHSVTLEFSSDYALSKIEFDKYIALIIRGNLFDPKVINLIELVNDSNCFLIFLLQKTLTIEEWCHVKENTEFFYVFPSVIEHYEFSSLLLRIKGQYENYSMSCFESIERKFDKTIFTKLTRLEALLYEITTLTDEVHIKKLQKELKILYTVALENRYYIVSYLSLFFMQEIERNFLSEKNKRVSIGSVTLFFLQRLRIGFQLKGVGKELELEVYKVLKKQFIDVFFVDDNVIYRDEIKKGSLSCGIEIEAVSWSEFLKTHSNQPAKIVIIAQQEKEKYKAFLSRVENVLKKEHFVNVGVIDFSINYTE